MTPEEAYARDAEAVGRAQHAEWKSWIVSQGYADHPLRHGSGPVDCLFHNCGLPSGLHHPDMVDWDSLPEGKRGKYQAHAAYLLGFEAGLMEAQAPERPSGRQAPEPSTVPECCWTFAFEHITDRALASCLACGRVMQRGRPYQRRT